MQELNTLGGTRETKEELVESWRTKETLKGNKGNQGELGESGESRETMGTRVNYLTLGENIENWGKLQEPGELRNKREPG